MNCRIEKISERRSYGEIGQRRKKAADADRGRRAHMSKDINLVTATGTWGDLNRNSIQEACRAQRDATAWLDM
jgi:hypothetical protein